MTAKCFRFTIKNLEQAESKQCVTTRGLTWLTWQIKRSAVFSLLVYAAMSQSAAEELEITISTLHGKMKYDIESFQVKPGTKVRLTFTNTDEMQHNLLRLVPGEG